jgi:bifunctional UDP-N-acetylglucosamine pyrophosphorylase/glucosamine-1-phosphate N-acetyltransferase
MNYQIIILAAGKGTRMGFSDLPKVLVPVKNKPIILRLVEALEKLNNSFQHIVVVGHKYPLVQAMLGSKYIYAFQEGQLGTGHAVASALKHVAAENTLILYGDMPFIGAESIQKLLDLHESTDSKVSMFTTVVPNFENEFSTFASFGRIVRNEKNEIAENIEFIDADESKRANREVNPSIYLFKTDWLRANIDKILKNKHGEYYLTDILAIAKKQNVEIKSLSIDPKEVFGINTPAQLQQAEKLL